MMSLLPLVVPKKHSRTIPCPPDLMPPVPCTSSKAAVLVGKMQLLRMKEAPSSATYCWVVVPKVVWSRERVPAATSMQVLALPSKYADRKSTRLNSSHLGISYAV